MIAIIQTPDIHLDCCGFEEISVGDLCATVTAEFAVSVLRRFIPRGHSPCVRKGLSQKRHPSKDWRTSRSLAQFAVAIACV